MSFKNYFNKILVFFFPERAGYWNSLTPNTISQIPTSLGRYYLDFFSKIDYPGEFNGEGIPLFKFKSYTSIEHPTVISQYAFGLFEQIFRENYSNRNLTLKYLTLADWFDHNKVKIANSYCWHIHIDYNPEYHLSNPWISAMTQGEAISVLTRATLLTGDQKYESIANEAFNIFQVDVKNGGLLNHFNSYPVFEECPTPNKPMVVLNGFIFALFGLYDLYLLNRNEKAIYLFYQGIESIKKLLPYFDTGKWTNYYLFDYPKNYYSSFTYHYLVTEQLRSLYFISGDKIFLEYSERWQGYSKSMINRSFVLFKKLTSSNKFSI